MVQESDRKSSLCFVLLLAFLLSFPSLSRAFHTRGEPREAIVAQAMLASDNWISPPAYNGAVPSKPPFLHWLIALSSVPEGHVTEASARFPSACAYVLFAVAFFLFIARRTSNQTALFSLVLLISSPEWLRSASTCRVDTLLAVSVASALLALFSWDERGRKGYPAIAGCCIACASLTKGPIGIVLTLGLFSLYRIIREGVTLRVVLRVFVSAIFIVVPVLCVVSSWYVAGYIERGNEFIQKIWYENVERFAGTMQDEPHKHSVFYLLGMLFIMVLPWSAAWVVALVRERRSLPERMREPLRLWREGTELERFSVLVAVVIVAFFCLPSSKRSVYLLPAYPFIAFLAASMVSRWEAVSLGLLKFLTHVGRVLTAAVLVGALALLAVPFSPWTERFAGSMREATGVLKLTVILVGFGMVWVLRKQVLGTSCVPRLGTSMIILAVVAGPTIIDPLMYQSSPKKWLESAEFIEAVHPERYDKMYSFGSEPYAASFYLQKPFFVATSELSAPAIVFVEERNIERFRSEIQSNFRELSRYDSGLEPKKKSLVVLEVVPR